MKHLYGKYSRNQIKRTKENLRKSIFFLLLCVDKRTAQEIKEEYGEVDVNKSFESLLRKIGGLNYLLMAQPELVMTMSLLQAAQLEYNNPKFDFQIYRKLILDAGTEVDKLKEG